MKDKILSALRTKYASFGLSKEALDRVASQKAKTITAEDGIDSGISDADTMHLIAKELQGSADSLRTRNAQIQKELDELKKEPPKDAHDSYAEKLAEIERKQAEMMEKFAKSEKSARDTETVRRLHEKMKSMGCTNDFVRKATMNGLEITENDTVESLAERLKPVYDANFKEAFGDGYRPPMGAGGTHEDAPDYSRMKESLKKSGLLPDKKQ